ncbi:hypothetical protein [Alicyclobacillus fastidiosus]|uniref:Uncharacterized protein n=1 Tax=Alicyclobacillus fastidiosus TaxID=392011 RepID=A0ABV5ADL3_9BACL|nr:hypothetical protein [Alicyclobacillus fastidiosus]WEH08629.1 hypothetical protein PYS47_18345 [Alicyclobacillus fastidiosus]
MTREIPGRVHWVMHKIVIPTVAITSSAAILVFSYEYHEKHLNEQLLSGQSAQALAAQIQTQMDPPPGKANTTSPQAKTVNDASGVNASKAGQTTASKQPTAKTARQSASGKKAVKKRATQSDQPAVTSELGSVVGGHAQTVDKSQLADTTVGSKVVQFGESPMTTSVSQSFSDGLGHQLTIPSGVAASDILAVKLQHGVIWATIPPTSVQPSGQAGAPETPTELCYTPFPTAPKAELTDHAQVVGQVPTTIAGTTLGVTWATPATGSASGVANGVEAPAQAGVQTNPPTSSANAQTSPQPVTSDSGANASAQVSENSSNAASTTNQVATKQAAKQAVGATAVNLLEMDQTDGGAILIFTLTTASGKKTDVIQYFDESTKGVRALAQLSSSSSELSWWAVGRHYAYWGTDSESASGDGTYTGSATLYDVATNRPTSISLGTWTNTTYAHGDSLVYQIASSPTWAEFTPNA